mmetsp:Transcript_43738/g.103308  ORF Transcript_43738/g.103308 Transcript_43738/m.103308 type:complete len:633 (+) Transcript_43738:105-2003(+)
MAAGAGEIKKSKCIPGSSRSGTVLAYVGNNWKLWNEKKAAVEVQHRDAKLSYSAACWIASSSSESEELFALGCTNGNVQVWNPNSGEIAGPVAKAFAKEATGVAGSVSALAPAPRQRRSLFAASESWPEILEVGIFDGSTRNTFKADKVSVSLLAYSPLTADWLLSAGSGSTLKLWSFETGHSGKSSSSTASPASVHAKFKGPANLPTCIDVIPHGGSVLALSCDGAAQVDVFTVVASTPSESKALAASFILSSHHAVHSASFVSTSDSSSASSGRLRAVGYGQAGALLWNFNPDKGSQSAKTITPAISVASTSLGGKVLCAHASRPPAEVQGASYAITICYGGLSRPAFTQVCSQGSGTTAKTMMSSLSAQSAPQAAGASKPQQSAAPLKVLGSDATGAITKRGAKRKAVEQEARDFKVPRLGLEELKNVRAGGSSAITAAPLVRQSIRAQDKASMSQIFQIADRTVVDSTVADIDTPEAMQLIREISVRLMSAPMEAERLGYWLRRVLVRHLTSLSQLPEFQEVLEPLRENIRRRIASWRTFSRLRGSLRMHWMAGKEADRQNPEVEDRRPLYEYVEGMESFLEDVPVSDEEDGGQEEDEDEDDAKLRLHGSDLELSDSDDLLCSDDVDD